MAELTCPCGTMFLTFRASQHSGFCKACRQDQRRQYNTDYQRKTREIFWQPNEYNQDFGGMSVEDIADELGLTHQRVSYIIRRSIRLLWRRKPGMGDETDDTRRYQRDDSQMALDL